MALGEKLVNSLEMQVSKDHSGLKQIHFRVSKASASVHTAIFQISDNKLNRINENWE